MCWSPLLVVILVFAFSPRRDSSCSSYFLVVIPRVRLSAAELGASRETRGCCRIRCCAFCPGAVSALVVLGSSCANGAAPAPPYAWHGAECLLLMRNSQVQCCPGLNAGLVSARRVLLPVPLGTAHFIGINIGLSVFKCHVKLYISLHNVMYTQKSPRGQANDARSAHLPLAMPGQSQPWPVKIRAGAAGFCGAWPVWLQLRLHSKTPSTRN